MTSPGTRPGPQNRPAPAVGGGRPALATLVAVLLVLLALLVTTGGAQRRSGPDDRGAGTVTGVLTTTIDTRSPGRDGVAALPRPAQPAVRS